jgi:cytochrome c oxidase subunit III
MATTEADPSEMHSGHQDHGHHDHPSFLAHHFDTPQQQFDSGKLGMWLFLVTEVLFFSGMFCAYAVFRSLRPDVFEGNSQFLNTKLGAINTGVLLFSSLTAAWGVRCSQMENHKGLVAMLASTISCAMIFLGVKAIEYSHKWGMGLLPAGMFTYDPAHPHGTGDHPNFLLYLCIPFALVLLSCLAWLAVSWFSGNKFQFDCAKPLTVCAVCFFVGVFLGTILESGESDAGDHHASAQHAGDTHVADSSSPEGDSHAAVEKVAASEESATLELLATDKNNSGIQGELAARKAQESLASGVAIEDSSDTSGGISSTTANVYSPRTAGVFFGIYYCMTGIHAIHILAGIGVMVWLLIRAVRQDFNRQYFGPVDYVALYWHIVDLIWIYLFPLLYLIR